jgi:rhodanese-related sulfurtransferase
MKKLIYITLIITCILLTACANDNNVITKDEDEEIMTYEQITPEKAKEIIDSGMEHILLDVREQSEYDEGHISGAILIPYTEIDKKSAEMLPDKDSLILVYCRSGRRSKIASESLVKLGYTNVKEFGGIIDWPYDVEK